MKTDKQIEQYALENILEEDSIEGFVKMKQWIEGAKWMRDNSDIAGQDNQLAIKRCECEECEPNSILLCVNCNGFIE